MSAAHPDPLFMTQLTRVIDRLDDVPQEDGVSRRERLLASAQQVCVAQQIPVTDAMIAQAVDQELSQVPQVTARTDQATFDFGWARPATPAQRERQRRWLKHQPLYVLQDFLTDLAPGDVVGTAIVGSLVALLVHLGTHAQHLSFISALVTFFLTGGAIGGGLSMAVRWAWKGWDQRTALEEATVSSQEVTRNWTAHAVVRAYVRRCLTSAVPQLLKGDVTRIEALIEREQAKVQATAQEERRVHERAALHEALMNLAAD